MKEPFEQNLVCEFVSHMLNYRGTLGPLAISFFDRLWILPNFGYSFQRNIVKSEAV